MSNDKYTTYYDQRSKITKSNGVITTEIPRHKPTGADADLREHFRKESARVDRKLSDEERADLEADKRNEETQLYLNKILLRVLSTLGFATTKSESAFQFVSSMIGALPDGYDSTEWVALSDEEYARHELGSLLDLKPAEAETEIVRCKKRNEKRREKFLAVQSAEGMPDIFLSRTLQIRTETAFRNQIQYRVVPEFRDLFRTIQADCPIGTPDLKLNKSILRHCKAYREMFEGAARISKKKKESSPESELHQAEARIKLYCQKNKKRKRPDCETDEGLNAMFSRLSQDSSLPQTTRDQIRKYLLLLPNSEHLVQKNGNECNESTCSVTDNLTSPFSSDGENGSFVNDEATLDKVAPVRKRSGGTVHFRQGKNLTHLSINNRQEISAIPEYENDPDWRGDF